MNLELNGKLVFITGGSKGIGFACAKAFLDEGARVAICSRGRTALDHALSELDGAAAFRADLSDAVAASDIVKEVESRLGPIDILVNSAGAAKRTPPDDLTPAAWFAAMNAKYFSTINVIDPVVKLMAHRRKGVIINIIGSGGRVASSSHLPGGSANAALMLATTGLATTYAHLGVRIVGVSPGLTETDRVDEGLKADARARNIDETEARALALSRIPIGRMALPQEVANVVLFMASDKASYVTGISLVMDGAQSAVIL